MYNMNFCFLNDVWESNKDTISNQPKTDNTQKDNVPKVDIDKLLAESSLYKADCDQYTSHIKDCKTCRKKLRKKIRKKKSIIKGIDDRYLLLALVLLFVIFSN